MDAARRSVGTLARLSIAVGVALALADASVVTLALPEVLTRLDTTVDGVAAVIGVYTVVLAVAVLGAVPLRARVGSRALGAVGMLLFAAAGVACGVADSLEVLLVARAAQAVGAAGGLVAGYALLHGDAGSGDGRPARLWVAGAVFGTAIGPALGGALTELFDWRAIFLAQAPFGVLAAVAALVSPDRLASAGPGRRAAGDPSSPTSAGTHAAAGARVPTPPRGASEAGGRRVPVPPPGARPEPRPIPSADERSRARTDRVRAGIALALVSAALTAVVFLLVLMLVTGWSLRPLTAALAVTILPVAAIAGSRIPGDPWARACGGAGLIGAGILALTAVPSASVAWVVVPQLLAGLGMGLALPALAGELLPERSPRDAAGLLSLRHVGITVALLILAPVTAAQLDRTVDHVEQQVTALVLDARLPPQAKLKAVGPALGSLNPEDARGSLRSALASQAGRFADDPDDARTYAALTDRADDTLISAVDGAFRPAFLITGILALLGAALVVPPARRRPALAVAVCVGALAVAGAQVAISRSSRPPDVVIADPCRQRPLPRTGGLDGAVQDVALRGLDRAACKFGSSREELALAIADKGMAKEYERRYGTDPRSVTGLIGGALTGGGGGVGDVLEDLLGGGGS